MVTRAQTAKRLSALEQPSQPAERRGLVLLPPILPVDEWEALAIPQQDALAAATREGVDDAPKASRST